METLQPIWIICAPLMVAMVLIGVEVLALAAHDEAARYRSRRRTGRTPRLGEVKPVDDEQF